MSNKPKNVKRLVDYDYTKAELAHLSFVREAKKQGYKHPGAKRLNVLRNIKPIKLVTKLFNSLTK